MLGLHDTLVQGCTAPVACHGNDHHLIVRGDRLVALDHASEAAKVLDALTDEVPCLQLVAAWDRTRLRYQNPGPDPYLMWLGTLIRADITVPEHEEWLQGEVEKLCRFQSLMASKGLVFVGAQEHPDRDPKALVANARAAALVLRLPEELRLYLGLLCVAEAVGTGSVNSTHAGQLESAAVACISSWVNLGIPAANVRIRVLRALMSRNG